MSVLVTGSAGHLGEALMRHFKATGQSAIGLDIKASPYTDIVGSIADKALVRDLMREVSVVLNTATLHKPHVVTHGPYSFIRHPNYLCVILELAALPLLHSAWLSALVLTAWNAGVLFVRIRTEEAMLMQIPRWRDAFSRRARLIPGVF